MAILFCTDKRQITTLPEIAKILTPIGVKLDAWPVPESQPLKDLLAKPKLTPSEQEEVLSSFLPRFDDLKKTLGYQTQDLIVLDPDLPPGKGLRPPSLHGNLQTGVGPLPRRAGPNPSGGG